MTDLTPKQEAFARKYIELGNASEAYRQSYDAANMKPEVVWVKACELLKSGNVAVRVAELQMAHQDRHNVTVDTLTEELQQARELALRIDQPAAMISATMGKAKLHGLAVDKADVTLRKPITELTEDEPNADIAEYERTAGALLPGAAGGEGAEGAGAE